MANIEKAIELMKSIAADDSHGYSQIKRDGKPDFDCSSLVLHCLKSAGFDTGSASYTGNMLQPLKKAGFKDVTKQVDLKTGAGILAGDVLLTPNKHVEMCVGSGKLAGARGDEHGGIEGKQKGDQTGKEIAVSSYYNYPWKYVLRYREHNKAIIDALAIRTIYGAFGNGEERKKQLGEFYNVIQQRVNDYYDAAEKVMDGKYGNGAEREAALIKAGFNYKAVQWIVNRTLWKI